MTANDLHVQILSLRSEMRNQQTAVRLNLTHTLKKVHTARLQTEHARRFSAHQMAALRRAEIIRLRDNLRVKLEVDIKVLLSESHARRVSVRQLAEVRHDELKQMSNDVRVKLDADMKMLLDAVQIRRLVSYEMAQVRQMDLKQLSDEVRNQLNKDIETFLTDVQHARQERRTNLVNNLKRQRFDTAQAPAKPAHTPVPANQQKSQTNPTPDISRETQMEMNADVPEKLQAWIKSVVEPMAPETDQNSTAASPETSNEVHQDTASQVAFRKAMNNSKRKATKSTTDSDVPTDKNEE